MKLRPEALLVLSALVFPAAAAGQQAAPPVAATYVGDEMCAGCHGDYAEKLAGTPHGGPGFAKLSPHGCETCHGPGSVHVEDPTIEANQPRIDRLTATAQSATCQQCHDGGPQFMWASSRHAARGLSCASCHSVHSPVSADAQLKSATAMDQCYGCHQTVRAEMWKTSHHPVREGRITCADCHNPHGTETPRMLKAASVNEQCYQCHTEKRGPFLWEHAPVRENCLTCHTPHGSNHLKLQKTSVPYLCQQCHLNTRHPGSLYDATSLAGAARQSNRIFNRACSDCHNLIHGSNHPSAPYLGH